MSVDTRPLAVLPQPDARRRFVRAGDHRQLLEAALRSSRGVLRWGRGAATSGARNFARGIGRRRVGLSIFLPAFVAYVTIGALLSFRYHSFAGDAQSRLANAFYVLYSRDPHLAAIGFVWNPLPSISVMPLLPLKAIFPGLVTYAFGSNVMSSVFMAGSVVLVHSFLRDLRVRVGARVAITTLFALQPMIILYGANGMSEAIFLFFLLLTTRRLASWIDARRTWDLVLGGVALAFAYLARVEAVVPAMLAFSVVAAVTGLSTAGAWRERARVAALNGFLFAAPAAFAFVIWATISWIIVGHPLEQFSSQYGNASQLQAEGERFVTNRGGIGSLRFITLQLSALAATLPIAFAAAAWVSVRRRDLRWLAPASVFGGVVLFTVVTFLRGQTAGHLRYCIAVIPLWVLLLGCGLARPAGHMGGRRWLRSLAAICFAVVVAAVPIGTSALAMSDKRVGPEEHSHLGYILKPGSAGYELRFAHDSAQGIASYLDGIRLPRGAVLMDNFTPCTPLVVLGSRHPKQFVITNDRDFQRVLADPIAFHAKYVLVPPRGGLGDLNEINRQYPTMYESGAGIAKLAHEFSGKGCPAFRLYQLSGSTGRGG
ncbi:MAG: hypothetical protein QOJ79_2778 [Actinomycetota bacterium]|jgi:hypothetical protein|nr:hypothetical protein [Actinomycetota bacterium]